MLATPPSLFRDVVWGPFPSLGVSGPSLLPHPLSPLGPLPGPTQPHPQAQRSPAPTASPPATQASPLRGTGPPVLSPRSRRGLGPSWLQVSTQQPVWPALRSLPRSPKGWRSGTRPAVWRQDACWASGSRWEPWACMSVQPGLPASPVPPSLLMGPGVAPGRLWAWGCAPSSGTGRVGSVARPLLSSDRRATCSPVSVLTCA